MAYFKDCENFIQQNHLQDAVNFTGHVDIKKALAERRVGYVLSVSDSEFDFPGPESFHLAIADSFAAHGLSFVRNWPGAEYLWESKYIYFDDKDLVNRILDYSSNSTAFQVDALAGSDSIKSNYSLDIFKNSIVDLYNEFL